MDTFTKKQRSWCMSRIRSKHTGPETKVRDFLKRKRFKFRLHADILPGRPDAILPLRKTAIFVNGCFWHQHRNCKKATLPKSNRSYWIPKLKRNVERQKSDVALLKKLGWRSVLIWECKIAKYDNLPLRFARNL